MYTIPAMLKPCRQPVLNTAFAVLVSLLPQAVVAAQLLMIEETGCVYCARFNEEIAPAYPKTTEGKRAPLRRVNIDNGWPEDLSYIKPEQLTPTFILVENEHELGRLYGYQGDEFFWYLLGEMLEKLEPEKLEPDKKKENP